MKRTFEIEYPDDCGPMWMNESNLMLCINAYCENKDGRIKAIDVTDKVARGERIEEAARDAFERARWVDRHGFLNPLHQALGGEE